MWKPIIMNLSERILGHLSLHHYFICSCSLQSYYCYHTISMKVNEWRKMPRIKSLRQVRSVLLPMVAWTQCASLYLVLSHTCTWPYRYVCMILVLMINTRIYLIKCISKMGHNEFNVCLDFNVGFLKQCGMYFGCVNSACECEF